MKNLFLILFALLFTCVSNAEEVYFCTSDFAQGILYNPGKTNGYSYKGKPFKLKVIDNYKSVITKRTFGKEDSYTKYECVDTKFENIHICNHFLDGKMSGDSFRFNYKNNRFITILSSFYGSISEDEPTTQAPDAMIVGSCEKF